MNEISKFLVVKNREQNKEPKILCCLFGDVKKTVLFLTDNKSLTN